MLQQQNNVYSNDRARSTADFMGLRLFTRPNKDKLNNSRELLNYLINNKVTADCTCFDMKLSDSIPVVVK